MDMPILTGAKAFVETLKSHDVRHVFGITGHTVMEVADELYCDGSIRTSYPRAETSGAFMAYGYNRIAGKPEAVGIWHVAGMPHTSPAVLAAYLDSVPLVFVGGNAWSNYRGRPAFQEMPIRDVFAPISKWAFRVERTEMIPEALHKAFLVSQTGRPGPCVLDVPFDKFVEKADVKIPDFEIPKHAAGDDEAVKKACDLLLKATRPILLAGGGVVTSNASEELRSMAEMLCIPVVTSVAGGRGVISDDHSLSLGIAGSLGWKIANEYINESDCWCSLGFSFSQLSMQEWTVEAPEQIVQIDIDPNQIGKIYSPTLGIVGDAKMVLKQMLAYLEKKVDRREYTKNPRFSEIKKRKDEWLAELQAKLDSDTKPTNPYRVMKEIRLATPPNAIIVADSGDNLCFALHALKAVEPKSVLVSQKLNAVGCGLPIAIGSKLAAPDRPVLAVTGDGALHYNFGELAMAAMEKIPITVLIMDNGYLNANKTISDFIFEGRHVWVKLNNPDWVTLAKSFGLEAERVENPEDISPAIKRGIKSELPYIIDVVIDNKVPPPMTGKPWSLRW